jgi:hypothetical protein
LRPSTSAKGLAQQTDVARQFLKLVDELENAELLIQEFQDTLLETLLKKTPTTRHVERIEAAVVLEQLRKQRQGAHRRITAVFLVPVSWYRQPRTCPRVLDELSARRP